MNLALGLVEPHGWSGSMVILDHLEKSAHVRLVQAELNDLSGACIKISGPVADVEQAIQAAGQIARALHLPCRTHLIAAPDPGARAACIAADEFNPLLEQDVVHRPKEKTVSQPSRFAIGLIETQGFTAVIAAIDSACKAASVEVIGREKLGGGYITIIVKGDVAAVRAAVDAGKAAVGDLGKLIATHVIAQPSAEVLGLLGKL